MRDYVEAFADLTVRLGVNVQPGQHVVISSDLEHAEVARVIVEHAYRAGASMVEVNWSDAPVRRSAAVHASIESLTAERSWMLDRITGWGDDGVAIIALNGNPYPHLMDGLDAAKVSARPAAESLAQRKAMFTGNTTWTVVSPPSVGWAELLFGEPDIERLWEVLAIAMRLDEPDPVAAWQERSATLAARATALDALALTQLHYSAPGTDLTAGLLPKTAWTGGGTTNAGGRFHLPNIPTEEVFTSPDRRRADGRIALARPLVLPGGALVEDLEVEFADGRIVNVAATSGIDGVRAQLDADEGARSLGEVSLVDRDSRIAKAGIVFHDTLFDENAGCHVAWGASFPFAVQGGAQMNPAARFELGLNASSVHTDVVIGGTGMTVTGTGPGGEVTIIRDDDWVLPLD
jgi:aminopeptidase